MLSPSILSNQGWNGTALHLRLYHHFQEGNSGVLLKGWLSLFQIPTQQNLYIHRRGTGVGQPLQDAGHLWPAAHGGVPRPGDVRSPAPRVRGGWCLPEGPKAAGNPILRKVNPPPLMARSISRLEGNHRGYAPFRYLFLACSRCILNLYKLSFASSLCVDSPNFWVWRIISFTH